ncbi:hypothetical protein [Burkholderia gladioli]|uniref:hypothetical protein n=1 Tax=Burkholderia gladioli TaxID=28095 RepID=UPI001640FBFE|nr:hypothetical protein [Burkholderia gladioli]
MKIHELLAGLADSELSMQGLNGAIDNIRAARGHNKVTFGTDALHPAMLLEPDRMPVCVLLFIDRGAWKREEAKAKAATPIPSKDNG